MNIYKISMWLHNVKKKFFPIRGRSNNIANISDNYKFRFDLVGNNNSIKIGKGKIHNTIIQLRGDNHSLVIEDGCYIKNTIIKIEDNFCSLIIGKGTTIEGAEIDLKEDQREIKIGRNCMFSDHVYITTSDSHSICRISDDVRINAGKTVTIGDNVWIGKRAMILKGAEIQSNVIIAAGSIVTDIAHENSVYGGIPARKIKDNVIWLRKRI